MFSNLFIGTIMTLLSFSAAHPQSSPSVTINNTLYKGTNAVDGVEAFLAIPYAVPPVGNLRFKPPQLLSSATCDKSVHDATKLGSACYQVHYLSPIMEQNLHETTPEDEDCLTLNVWKPSGMQTAEKLPVMIWLFGGTFSEGATSVPIYNPEKLVQQNPSVLVVTFNYRVGVFGFPNSPVLHGNLGFLDQRLAVEWVRDNIGNFGGDPERMILFGESAGAVSISAYSFVYKDDPIVKGFIMESGTSFSIGNADHTEWNLAAASVGCTNQNLSKELECMEHIDARKLIRGISISTVNPIGAAHGGSPFVDNTTVFSQDEYISKLQAGDFAKLPVLLGNNNNEGDGVVNFSSERGLNETLSDLITEALFTCAISSTASALHNHSVPVWRYRYMPVFPIVTFYPFIRTYHISEVPMVLGSYDKLSLAKTPSQTEIDASKLIQRAWVSFAHDPSFGLSKDFSWPKYDPKTSTLIKLFENNTLDIEFVDPNIYDAICATHPSITFQELGAPPP